MRKCGHDPRITLILYFTNIYVRLLCAWDFCKPGFLTHRVSLTALWGTCCYYPRLTGKETDTRSQVPAQELVWGLGFQPSHLVPESKLLSLPRLAETVSLAKSGQQRLPLGVWGG